MHDVLRVIEERVRTGSRPGQRSDGLRVALAIEGGGMRGTVSAGMALALHERGLMSAFDAVYGSSAGAITGAWLLSSEPERLRGWAHPDYARTMIRWSALLHRRPVADVRTLVEVVYQTEWPMDFESILASPIEFHPLATDAATGAVTDLRPMISNPAELRLALRASAALPFLAGPPVRLRGRRYYDAGVAETIPFRTPVDQGATHILVLRSRRPLDLTDDSAAGGPDVIAGEATGDGWAGSEGEAVTERCTAGDVRARTGGAEAIDGQLVFDGAAANGTADNGGGLPDQVKLDLVDVIEVTADSAGYAGIDRQDAFERDSGIDGDARTGDRREADSQRDTRRRAAAARAAARRCRRSRSRTAPAPLRAPPLLPPPPPPPAAAPGVRPAPRPQPRARGRRPPCGRSGRRSGAGGSRRSASTGRRPRTCC